MLVQALLFLGLTATPKPLARIFAQGGLVQVTGRSLRAEQTRFRFRGIADPLPVELEGGKVGIFGTTVAVSRAGAHRYLEFDNERAFLAGEPFAVKKLGLSPALHGTEMAWDFNLFQWPGGPKVLYAGVMRPTVNRKNALWPDDNWTRRIYPFEEQPNGEWKMRERPLFNGIAPGDRASMVGHAYGANFKTLRLPNGQTEVWLFHEEISRETVGDDGKRHLVTEIFARKMLDPFTASPEKVLVVSAGDPPRFGKRANGDYLLEGGRPFEERIEGKPFHLIGLSGADYHADSYDIHFAYSEQPIAPYRLVTDHGLGEQLTSHATDLKAEHGLSWLGRPAVRRSGDGSLRVVFHGTRKDVLPSRDYSGKNPGRLADYYRAIFHAPLAVTLRDGAPAFELTKKPTPGAAAR